MGKSNLIVALGNAHIYNSLLNGCKVCFKPFTVKIPKRTKDKHIGIVYTLVSILSIKGLHVSKSGKSICCEVEYSDNNNAKLFVTFNDDKTALILHKNNIFMGTLPSEYLSIENPEI